jgi:hypothetical protein
MTNLDISTFVDFDRREHEAFIGWISELNEQLGRRCRDLVLTEALLDWEPHGVYGVAKASKNKLKITHKFAPQTIVITVDATGEFHVDSNFSESRAIIRDRNSDWRKPCAIIFAELLASSMSKKKQPMKRKAKTEEVPEDGIATGVVDAMFMDDGEDAGSAGHEGGASSNVQPDMAIAAQKPTASAAQRVCKVPRPVPK